MIRGLNALETRLSGECRMAADLFASALCESPGLLLAHYGLTVANYLGVLEQWDEQPELAKARIRENARACVRIDCDSPDTSLAMGLCHIVEGRVNDAISVLDQATEANPGLSSAFSLLGQLHAMKGSTDLACRHLEEGVRLSVYTPAYTRNQGALAILRFIVGDYAGVIAACRTGLLYDTGYIGFQALLASASALAGVPEPKRVGQALQQMRPDFRIEQFAPFLRDVAPAHRHRFVEGLRMAGWPVTAL
jgi:tetratricopeptide (TPR) repeat protein